MIRGVMMKTIREAWVSTLMFGMALMGIMALLTFVLPQVHAGLDEVMNQLPFIRPFLTALLGSAAGEEITAKTMQAFLWVHPTVLAIVWAHEIVFCTRVPAGEIDRGTIDFLLGLPVSRRSVYCAESLVWLASGLLIVSLGLCGHRLTVSSMPEAMRPALPEVMRILFNLYCVYVAVGGIAFLVSSLSDRKGRAMAVVFAVVLASFLINFLAQFWEPAKSIAFLSVMNYYEPAAIIRDRALAASDIVPLLTTGTVAWAIGAEIIARRSICTV